MDVNGEKITFRKHIVELFHYMDFIGDVQGISNGEICIITVDFHAQSRCCVSYRYTDSAKTDDTQSFSHDFTAFELAFSFFYLICDISCKACRPGGSSDDISGSQQHSGDDHLLYRIGVCTGSVEHGDSRFCAFVDGNIVYAHAGSGNAEEII